MKYWVFLFAGDGVLFDSSNFATLEAAENYIESRHDYTGTPLIIKGVALDVRRSLEIVEPTEK